tara:strand:- start:1940 stop:2086 length:147 start_codon:yes stop_codon:yes gene_type:complete
MFKYEMGDETLEALGTFDSRETTALAITSSLFGIRDWDGGKYVDETQL